MRNLFKKSLAFCLVAALALTCFVGSFSVSAATYNATISVDNQTITQGTTSVSVPLTITSTDAGINEALIKVSSTLGTIAAEATVTADSPAVIEYDEDATDYGTFYLSAQNVEAEEGTGTTLGAITSATITVVFTVDAEIATGDYDIVIDIPTDKVIAASKDEDIINFSYETAKVTVEEAVTECEHANTEFYYDDDHEIVAAQGELSGTTSVETAKGKIYFKCTDCGEIIEEEVSYYYYYTTGTQNAALESEILYNFKAQPKHLNMQGTFQDAYFVLDMEKEKWVSS